MTKQERILYALVLVFGGQLSNEQIADHAGCSLRSVYRMKSRVTLNGSTLVTTPQSVNQTHRGNVSPQMSPQMSLNNEVVTPNVSRLPDNHAGDNGKVSPEMAVNTEYMLFNNTSKETKRKKDTVRERLPECADFFDWCKDEFFRVLKRKPAWNNWELKNFSDFWDGISEAHDIDTLKNVFRHFLTIKEYISGHRPTVFAKYFDMYYDEMAGETEEWTTI